MKGDDVGEKRGRGKERKGEERREEGDLCSRQVGRYVTGGGSRVGGCNEIRGSGDGPYIDDSWL